MIVIVIVVVIPMTMFDDDGHFVVIAVPVPATIMIPVPVATLNDDCGFLCLRWCRERQCQAESRQNGKCKSNLAHKFLYGADDDHRSLLINALQGKEFRPLLSDSGRS